MRLTHDMILKVRNYLVQVFRFPSSLEAAFSSILVTAFMLFRFRAELQLRKAILFIGRIPSAADQATYIEPDPLHFAVGYTAQISADRGKSVRE